MNSNKIKRIQPTNLTKISVISLLSGLTSVCIEAKVNEESQWQQLLADVQITNSTDQNTVDQNTTDQNLDDNKNPLIDKPVFTESEKNRENNNSFIDSNEQINKQKQNQAKLSQKKIKARIYVLDKSDAIDKDDVLDKSDVLDKNDSPDKQNPDNFTLKPANTRIQPFNNIKSALEDIYQDTLIDFQSAQPKLKQTVKKACEAVGYYDVKVRFEQDPQTTNNGRMRIKVIVESVGDPVRVENRVLDIRGEGKSLAEFQAMEDQLPPLEGQIFNQGEYQATKIAVENASQQMGFFDGKWLNNSADVILPDNTADIDLIYDAGKGYTFDQVVFFTIDESTGKLTTDPNKLPVKIELLQQLLDFNYGDRYNAVKVAQLSNDLTTTGYFNRVDVDEVLPKAVDDDVNFESSNNTSSGGINHLQSTKTESNSEVNNSETPIDIALIAFPDGLPKDIDKLSIKTLNKTVDQEDIVFDGTADSILETLINDSIDDAIYQNHDSNDPQLASIIFEIDDSTNDKYQAIERKANTLLRMPDDTVLNKQNQQAKSTLGKISDAISSIAQKILPDDDVVIEERPNLANKITPNMVEKNKKVPLYVFVASNKPYDAQIGIGYGTDTGVRLTSKFDNNLINRDGYQAGVSAEWSKAKKKLSLHASRPWKHPLDDKLNAGISYEETVIDQTKGNDWTTQSMLASLARNKYSGDDSGWNRHYSLRYRYDRLNLGKDIQVDRDKLPVEFGSSNPTQQALLLGYSLNKTTVDNIANPTHGFRQHYSLELGADSVLSDTNMVIARAGVSGIYSFGEDKRHRVIGKLNTGYLWADDFKDVPYSLRFFAGGDQNIRGYDYNSLSPIENGYLKGGQVLAVGSAEYNYEFMDGFRGAVFADVGNAYDTKFKTPTKVGLGFGIRWASPVGAVRLDVGAGVMEKDIPIRLHFFIGSPL